MLTIEDLGVLRGVEVVDGCVVVVLTPTYSGCPAMDAMRADVASALSEAGFDDVRVVLTLAPAWTTDWMTDAGKQKLREFGIAPPNGASPHGARSPVRLSLSVKCPHCSSLNTHELSRFGSTSCKALYECGDCLEPFDYFKVL